MRFFTIPTLPLGLIFIKQGLRRNGRFVFTVKERE